MATKSTEKKTSLEPSEVFCAAGLLMPTSKINQLVKDNTGGDLIAWASTDGLNVVSQVQPLDPRFKKMFSDALTLSGKKRDDLVANIVAGFSAAIGVKNFIKSMGDNVDIVDNVYLTGARWPAAVQKFQLKNENSGFDYNSSDFVVEVDDRTFYGISLKKKKNVKEMYEPKAKHNDKVAKVTGRLKSVSDFLNHPDVKPVFPKDPPPEMINGRHPDLVDGEKVSNRYNRLDPISAKAMPKTGNSKIDAKVAKALKKPK